MSAGVLLTIVGAAVVLAYIISIVSDPDRKVTAAVNLLPADGPSLQEQDLKTIDLYLREWQIVIQTQMHFNDLIIRFRAMSLTAFVALAGASMTAGTALGFTGGRLQTILALPFVFWIAALVIDLFYYHRLLLGAVAQAAKFDNSEWLRSKGFFGLTSCIREHARPGVARGMVAVFYLVPLIAAVVVVWK